MKLAAICGAAFFSLSSNGYSEEIRVSGGACGEEVRLTARDAPLSKVLKRLGESLGFRLVYQSQLDPLITWDKGEPPIALIRDLARGMNFSVEQIVDRRCKHGSRIGKVSVLPDHGDKTSTPVIKKSSYTPEMERVARQGLSDYLRSHGMEDQTIESIAVK